MSEGELIIFRGGEVRSILDGREQELLEIVRRAYIAHAGGESSMPHSTFLNFPDKQRERIIALPAYLGEEFKVAGVKWIASFPDNSSRGMDRASAVVIMNSLETGRPEVLLEGSVISAKRTAASAALAARSLSNIRTDTRATLVGCGVINFEIARFLRVACPLVKTFSLFDIDRERAGRFKESCEETFGDVKVEVVAQLSDALSRAPIISFATTAVKPHVSDLSACAPGSTILHISLRDLTPEVVLTGDNVVDDVDHVCRAQTSIHLAEQLSGGRDFIRCALAEVLTGAVPPRRDNQSIAIFSPFGLGVLDLAVGKFVRDLGIGRKFGTVIDNFLP